PAGVGQAGALCNPCGVGGVRVGCSPGVRCATPGYGVQPLRGKTRRGVFLLLPAAPFSLIVKCPDHHERTDTVRPTLCVLGLALLAGPPVRAADNPIVP